MTFGEKLYEALALERASTGSISKSRWLEIAQREFDLSVQALGAKAAPKRTRAYLDTLYDALAYLHGGGVNLTRSMRGCVLDARKQILEASPGVTAEEINKRISKYRQRHPTWPCTATALCKHWGELGVTVAATQAAKDDPYQEPAGDWKAAALRVTGASELPEEWATWAGVPHNWKEQIKKATLQNSACVTQNKPYID